jgi:hypothetical protein
MDFEELSPESDQVELRAAGQDAATFDNGLTARKSGKDKEACP